MECLVMEYLRIKVKYSQEDSIIEMNWQKYSVNWSLYKMNSWAGEYLKVVFALQMPKPGLNPQHHICSPKHRL